MCVCVCVFIIREVVCLPAISERLYTRNGFAQYVKLSFTCSCHLAEEHI